MSTCDTLLRSGKIWEVQWLVLQRTYVGPHSFLCTNARHDILSEGSSCALSGMTCQGMSDWIWSIFIEKREGLFALHAPDRKAPTSLQWVWGDWRFLGHCESDQVHSADGQAWYIFFDEGKTKIDYTPGQYIHMFPLLGINQLPRTGIVSCNQMFKNLKTNTCFIFAYSIVDLDKEHQWEWSVLVIILDDRMECLYDVNSTCFVLFGQGIQEQHVLDSIL